MKMKILIILILTLTTSCSFADSTSNDFGTHSGEVKKLSIKELRKQLEITGHVYLLNEDGDILYSEGREEREWKFGRTGDIISHWSFSSDAIELIALKHVWSIDKKGRIQVHIQQYSDMKQDRKRGKTILGKLIKERKMTVSNFEPITWKVTDSKNQIIAVRFTPKLKNTEESQTIGKLPISAKNMIVADNRGFVWTHDASFSGEYVSLKTTQGTLYMSYQKFKGAREIGFANGNKMRIDIGKKHYLRLVSTSPLLPYGTKAKVFGKVDLNRKGKSGSTHITSSSEEKDFLSAFK